MLDEYDSEESGSRSRLRFERPGFAVRRRPPAVEGGSRTPTPRAYEATSEYVTLKVHLHQQLLEMINLSAIEKLKPEEFRMEAAELVKELLFKEQIPLNSSERNKLVDDITDEVLGLGPIEPLLKDPTVSDVIINTHERVFVERAGQLEPTEVKFKDEKHLLRIIDKIVSRVGRRVDESSPMVDARLPDGSRVNAIIPPLAVDGPLVSIRKFAAMPFDLERLVANATITTQIKELLAGLVKARLSILISGGTGSGKTTFLNALSRHINNRERIVTIEDAAELQLQQIHVARLETRPANVEGRGEITQRDLVKNALRMRPDRIIVGEVRGNEAFDMLQAMNTGHDGSMTTIHANSCRDAFSRLEQMISMTGFDLPPRSMRQQIASAIDVVLQLNRFEDGTRRLVSLHEVTGMEGDIVTMQEIFAFQRTGVAENGAVRGQFVATGIRPSFTDTLRRFGVELPADIFAPSRAA
jgi:pilus assembly protein CpaF